MLDATRELALDDRAAEGLARGEPVVLDAWLGPVRALALRLEVTALVGGRHFKPAGIGAARARVVDAGVRRDSVCWFDPAGAAGLQPGPQVARFLTRLGTLLKILNRSCFLGLQRVECHAACFEPGAFYGAHKDTFAPSQASHADESARVISYCYYLNDDWLAAAGGCLRLHTPDIIDVAPLLDRLVVFRSADLDHEVLPTTVQRLSLTGWMSRPGH